jgi:hypothetical protein
MCEICLREVAKVICKAVKIVQLGEHFRGEEGSWRLEK